MFKVEFRVSDPLVVGKWHLTRDWQTLETYSASSDAEIALAWLADEISEFAACASKPRSVEYRILTDSGELLTSNKV